MATTVDEATGAVTRAFPARPFRLAIVRAQGFLEDRFTARGTVDLACAVACFNDPRLAEDVGYPLGVAPSQLARILGPHPDQDVSFRFEVVLPGRVSSSDAQARTKDGLVWVPALGRSTSVVASTEFRHARVSSRPA